MRYASVRKMDISNGENVGVALFVQGCPEPHCYNCFNTETWDFSGGKEWTEEIKNKFLELINKPYIKRVTLIGGEPLAKENAKTILDLVNEIRVSFPDKTIWVYSRYTFEQIFYLVTSGDIEEDYINDIRKQILRKCDVLVDGRYIDSQRDITLKWRGSKNQRVIDLKESFKQKQIVLYCD